MKKVYIRLDEKFQLNDKIQRKCFVELKIKNFQLSLPGF